MIGPAFEAFFCTLISFLYAQTGRAFLHPNGIPDALRLAVHFCTLMVYPMRSYLPCFFVPFSAH